VAVELELVTFQWWYHNLALLRWKF